MKRLALITAIMALGLSGCLKNPFSTRGSQQPVGSSGTWETPATPDVAIVNLFYAYNEKNIQNYEHCFDDTFRFSAPQDSVEAEAQGNGYLYQGWDKTIERQVTEGIFANFLQTGRYLDLLMVPSADYPDSIGDSTYVIYRDYTLRTIVSDTLGTDTTTFRGLAAFHLSQSAFSFWSIYLWEELPSEVVVHNWAQFKALYRTR